MPSRILLGILLLLLGVGYLLDQLGLPLHMHALFGKWWPLLIIVIGLNWLVRRPMRPWWPVICVTIGLLLQLWRLHLLRQDFWPAFWAVALIVLGIRLLVSNRRGKMAFRQPLVKDQLSESVTFATLHYRDDATCFQGGVIDATFSNYELDLRWATLAPGGALLELRSNCSNITVRVPPEWGLTVSGSPIFGACLNKTQQAIAPATGQPMLHVQCAGQVGAVEITN